MANGAYVPCPAGLDDSGVGAMDRVAIFGAAV